MDGQSSRSSTPKSSPQRITPTSRSLINRASASFESSTSGTTPSTPQVTDTTINNNNDNVRSTPLSVQRQQRDSSSRVHVAVRIRPLLHWEKKECVCQVVQKDSIQFGGHSGPRFTFDNVFDSDTTQAQLFDTAVQPLIQKCLEGYNATIFAYGQTGSGKTYSMLGPADSWLTYNADEPESSSAGILPRALHALFAALNELAGQDPAAFSYSVTLQFLEVYGEDIRDLLAPRTALGAKLTVREFNDGETGVPGAVAEPCSTALDAARAVEQGSLRRVTAATAMNATSSRSHALLTVAVEQRWEANDSAAGVVTKRSKFQFCDLAGSERQKRTQASGQRLKEGININQGLLVLGNVISALASNSSHVPYRDSKLTRLLSSSLGGNSQTLMLSCVSPAPENMEESLNCLRYANRAKNIQNVAIVNLDANSRRVLQLQQQISSLAQVLLQVLTTAENEEHQNVAAQIPFDRADLEAMMSGGGMVPIMAATPASARTPQPPTPSPGVMTAPWSQPQHNTPGIGIREDFRLTDMESRIASMEKELLQTRNRLKESQEYHDAAELELARYRAMEKLGESLSEGDQGDKENTVAGNFLEKATEYEQQISFLKKELQKAERKANRIAMWQTVDPQDDEQRLKDAETWLKQDQLRLTQLRSTGPQSESHDSPGMLQTFPADALDEEEQAEQADLQKWTKKYLAQGGHVEEEDEHEKNPDTEVEDTVHSETPKHLELEVSLAELTKSIAERERLIGDLKSSQEKFASMRDFYENKLERMEAELKEKEHEREKLVEQLQDAKTRGSTKDLQERLREKDSHIASLREKQKNLRKLTGISQRNEVEISRLQKDVVDMKRRRVDVEKQLTSERKRHIDEVKLLKKSASQKEREINKLQKISNQREMQAKKAEQVAKARLDELKTLRAKSREAEKRKRMQTVKNGMMEKAGIDSVLVGQTALRAVGTSSRRSPRPSDIDADALRSLFDKKISDVVRKEALADKLAAEWEEHYDLTTRKQDLMESTDPDAEEDLQTLSVKIKYKQQRIRQLAQKLGRQELGIEKKKDDIKKDYELFDDQFQKICKDANPEQSQKTLVKVLFGMVVKERRRISALAKTASSLDDKLQQTERTAEESEAHLRAYRNEQRQLAAELSRSQQRSILSLMEMVQSDRKAISGQESSDEPSNSFEDRKLLVLANERITELENQIEHLESEADQEREQPEELLRLQDAYSQECAVRDEMKVELQRTFGKLQEVREHLSIIETEQDHHSIQRALGLLDDLLLRMRTTRELEISSPIRAMIHSKMPSTFDDLESDLDLAVPDEDEVTDDPDWALELMEDLAFIAEGKIPPALQNLPGFAEQVAEIENAAADTGSASVFDRLTNPENFTGTQKMKAKKSRRNVTTRRPKFDRIAAPSDAEQTSNISIVEENAIPVSVATPENATHTGEVPSSEALTSRKRYKSVFERLLSPSQATGTQRQRLQTKNQEEETTEELNTADMEEDHEDLERMLDDALGGSSESMRSNDKGEVFEKSASLSYSSSGPMETPIPKEQRPTVKSSEYAEQDVFERLQRTATVSSQNRQGEPVRHDSSERSSMEQHHGHGRVTGPGIHQTLSQDEALFPHDEDQQTPYTQLNVFERLQKTKTEAYAKKVHRPKGAEDDGH